jgi:PEP-CTERM motif
MTPLKVGTRLAAVLMCALTLFVVASRADTTYTYAGNPFNQFGGSAACPPQCSFSGFFTVAGPLPDSSTVGFTPLTFSFTDGLSTVTQANALAFEGEVITNSSGEIVSWNLGFDENSCVTGPCFFSGTNPPGCMGCRVVDGSFGPEAFGFAEIDNSPGVWTMSTSAPEPSSLLLLGMGLMATVGSSLRKKKSRVS